MSDLVRDLSPPALLQLVADSHRWRLLAELAASDRRVAELTEAVGEPQNLVSYHLGLLRNAGLVTARRSSADGRDVYYRADLALLSTLFASAAGGLHPGLQLVRRLPHTPVAKHPSPIVLFLCTGNSARSQMAEALVTQRSGDSIRARSAGSHPKRLHPNAIRVMAERGIDISGHSTKHLRRFSRSRFDRVITLCDKVREICPEFPGRPVAAHWSMPDPAAEGDSDESSYPAFCRIADELEVRIDLLIADLTMSATDIPTTERRSHAH